MREIKFRGMTTKGEMIYGSLVITNHTSKQHTKTWIVQSAFGNGGWFNVMGKQYVRPETVGQFTGMRDKNGKDIYYGDIVRDRYLSKSTVDDVLVALWIIDYDRCNTPLTSIEVIGNIHEKVKP